MTNFGRKFILLLWKNYIVQRRHKIQTVVEILAPVFFSALLVLIRYITVSEKVTVPTHYMPFDPGDFSPPMTFSPQTKDLSVCCNEIVYSPNSPLINELMENIKKSGSLVVPLLTGFPNENAMVEYQSVRKSILGGVAFKNIDLSATSFPNAIHYSLRFPGKLRIPPRDRRHNPGSVWLTEYLYPLYQLLGPRGKKDDFGATPYYSKEGFLYLQHTIDKFLTKALIQSNFTYPTIKIQRFPYPPYINDRFLVALQGWLPMIFMLSFIYPAINITKSIVHEKEKRLKETMKMMGLPNYLHWIAWFVKSFTFLLISAIFMIVMIKIPWFENGDLGVITYGGATLLFVFLISYIVSVISLAFLISTFFKTANSAATAAGVIFFMTYFPYLFLSPRYQQLSLGAKLMASLMSNTGMAFGCQIIAMFEGSGAGIQWSTLNSGSSPDDHMSILNSILMLLLDSGIYLLITWYVDAVRPGAVGTSLPWNFPFTKSYWTGEPILSTKLSSAQVIPTSPIPASSSKFEPVESSNMKIGIQIQNLTKIFNGKTAVKSLNLEMYEGQITALLGHNGAGKTTTMSMLTGLIEPTYGSAIVNGFNIRSEMTKVRGSLGLCPQHDVLFDELTVQEHLQYFCEMKGMSPDQVPDEIDRMLKSLNLEPKRHAQAQQLSGGMKRKLCVGIALVAGSKIVLLDEPTSGMDPGARRSTWDLLQDEKKGRTLVLSTVTGN